MTRPDLEVFRNMVEHAPTMMWRAGADAQCDYFNAAWLAFRGRSLEQEAGHGWTEGLHPDDAQDYLALYRERFEPRERLEAEYRLRRSDGMYRYVLVRAKPYFQNEGAFGGYLGSCVDVDDMRGRKAASVADDFFEMSLDNVCVAGFDGYFKRVSSSWSRTLGWTPEELMSRPIVEFVHVDDRSGVFDAREQMKSGDGVAFVTNRYRCKDGSYRWFEWRSVAHVDRGRVYAVARDITEQKRSEARLREAQEREETLQRQLIFADRMASVGTLAAGVAHEINNPLSYVTANIAMMLEEIRRLDTDHTDQWEAFREMSLDAREGAERIRKIVAGLKTFSRAEEEQLEVVDVLPLLEMSIGMTNNEIRQRARLVKDFGAIPRVEVDEARLGQVFVNLLVNAAQAIPEGDATDNEICVATSTSDAGRAVIEVRDTGVGIPAPLLERVFDPFFTTKPVGVGTGLGLSICHNIVTGLGGEITITSEEGKGTSFRVVLPAAAAVPNDAVAEPAVAQDVVSAAVLVVDDEPSIGRVLGRILQNHDVTAVTDAREGLRLLDSGKDFHIILSDLLMPDMSGMDFYAELTSRFPSAAERVVFISGGAFTPKANDFLDHVSNELLDKPFDQEGVREVVQRYANRQ